MSAPRKGYSWWANPLLWVLVALLAVGGYGFNSWWAARHTRVVGKLKTNEPPVKRHQIISAGAGNAGFALAKDGSVWTWGPGSWDGWKVTGAPPPADLYDARHLSGVDRVVAISAAAGVLALRDDGTVWAAGNNPHMFLRADAHIPNDSKRDLNKEGKFFSPVHGLSGVKQVIAGVRTMYALKTDGTLWAWGENTWGQFGAAVPLGARVEVPRQIEAPAQTQWVGTIADWHSAPLMALDAAGKVWVWGEVLHMGVTYEERQVLTQKIMITPHPFRGLKEVRAVVPHYVFDSGAVLQLDGSISLWGADENWLCGHQRNEADAGEVTRNAPLAPAEAMQREGVGYNMLRADASVWRWGWGGKPQGPTACMSEAEMLLPAGSTREISSSSLANYALKTDGSVVFWGEMGGAQPQGTGPSRWVDRKQMKTIRGLPPLI